MIYIILIGFTYYKVTQKGGGFKILEVLKMS